MRPDDLRRLAAAGLSVEQIAVVMEIMDEDVEARRANGRARWRKHMENKRNANVSSKKQALANDGDGMAPLPLEERPHTPKEDTPAPPTTHKEKTPKGVQKKGSRLPSDFVPDLDWAQANGLSLSHAQAEAAKFQDFWTAKPGQAGVKLDWPATWRNWVRSAVERRPMARAGPAPPKPNPGLAAVDSLLERMNAVTPSPPQANPPYPRLVAPAGSR